jgi:hypothetical protein
MRLTLQTVGSLYRGNSFVTQSVHGWLDQQMAVTQITEWSWITYTQFKWNYFVLHSSVNTTFIKHERYTHFQVRVRIHPTAKRNVGRPRKGWRDQHPRRRNRPTVACTVLLTKITLPNIPQSTVPTDTRYHQPTNLIRKTARCFGTVTSIPATTVSGLPFRNMKIKT